MRFHILFIVALGFSFTIHGQEISNVNAAWLDTEIELSWSKKLDFELKQSTRYVDFFDQFAVSNTTFKASYELNDWLKVRAAYRYSYRERNSRKFNRYQLALQAAKKLGDIKMTLRSRFEYRTAIDRDNKVSRWRNRLSAGYKIDPIDVNAKAFIEYWYTFDDPISDFTKYRIGASLTKEVINNLDLKLGYAYDSDIDPFEIERENIIVLGLIYKIKRR